MSNKWSASVPTFEHNGRPVHHRYSKREEFEATDADLRCVVCLTGTKARAQPRQSPVTC